MAIVILIVCFASVFLYLGITTSITSKKELLIASVLVFSAILVYITELLSFFHQLNYRFMFISWSVVTSLLIICLYLNNKKVKLFSGGIKSQIKNKFKTLTASEKILLTSSAIILLLIFIQALLYPPNNWDAMTYHMARITSWISHQSLSHYPTHITRQLYQPPFAEYVIMNFGILSHSDVFSNLVQFVFHLFSLISIVLLIESLGLSKEYKVIAIMLGVTIPEVILQSSSTQNDLVTGFFIITAFLFSIKTIKDGRLKNFVFVGLATGLGILTKGTAYLFLPPILLLFGIILLIQLFKTKNYNYLWYPLIIVVLVIGLNWGHYSRNYQLTHNILGVDKAESVTYSNQKMNAGILLSGIIKNAGLHMAVMYVKPVARLVDTEINKIHRAAGIDIDDPATNYRNMKFITGGFITDEEGWQNPFHFVFITISLLLIIINFINGKRNIIAGCLFLVFIMQVIFFCFYLKWQPWHSRLHTPLFLITIPLICYCLSTNAWFKKVYYWISPVILIYALLVVLHSNRRPYTNALYQPRYQKYFIGNTPLYPEYDAITKETQKLNYKNIGLLLGEDSWEYPLFTQCFNKDINPVYISVNNFSKNAVISPVNIDCIISTTTNLPFIDFKGRHFVNTTANNKIIWLYE